MGQSVMAKNFGSGSAWIPRVIVEQIGPLTYVINNSDGRLWKHHVDHIKEYAMPRPCPEPEDIGNDDTLQPLLNLVNRPETRVEVESNGASPLMNLPPNIILPDPHSPARNAISDPSPPRRHTSHHSPIDREQYPTQKHSWPDYYHDKLW